MSLRGDMKTGFAEIKADIAGMRQSFAEERTANVKWMVALAGAVVAILGAWTSFNRPQAASAPAPAAQQAPFVIVLPNLQSATGPQFVAPTQAASAASRP